MRVLMWEARGDVDGLLRWWREQVRPALPETVTAELFRSADRVVALIRCAGDAAAPELSPPADLLAGAPHAWPFETVD